MDNENLETHQENNSTEKETGPEQPGWFQEFVDHYDVDKPKQGEMLKGTILDIQENSILLDVGLKKDAIIPGQDLEKVDKEIKDGLIIGSEIIVSVIRTPLGDDDLLVSLSRGIAHKTWVKADEMAKSDDLIELEVVDQNRGGLLVAYDNLRGFIPNSHIPSIRRGTSTQNAGEIKSELIGKRLPVKLIEVNQKERRLVFSARVAQKDQRLKRLNEIEVGKVFKSRVVNVVDFGVFVDLEGVDGLVHKSEIDWDRLNHPSKLFNVGDEIEVKVVGVDIEKQRVSLSRKAILPNPWLKLADKYNVGDLVQGIIVSVLDFGAFVELEEGLQGLVHVSELGYANMENKTGVVQKGDQVLVRIMGIDPGRERVSLSMRRVPVSEQMDWMMNLEDSQESLEQEGLIDSQEPEDGELIDQSDNHLDTDKQDEPSEGSILDASDQDESSSIQEEGIDLAEPEDNSELNPLKNDIPADEDLEQSPDN